MTYAISDLHGYPVEKLKALLDKAGFSDNDTLYILGDVIDRNGDGGVSVLLWLLEKPNVRLILGNHEAMLLSCSFALNEDFEENMTGKESDDYLIYTFNGGEVTLKSLRTLPGEKQKAIIDFLRACPLYETVTAGGRDYILVHAGFDNFDKSRPLSDYTADELLWAWPDINDEYFDDVHTVFGHTPTKCFGEDYDGRILRTKNWTCIDCGAAYGNEPVLLRLDDNKEFRL
jgi:serine/threonine protein phosphatase 1